MDQQARFQQLPSSVIRRTFSGHLHRIPCNLHSRKQTAVFYYHSLDNALHLTKLLSCIKRESNCKGLRIKIKFDDRDI